MRSSLISLSVLNVRRNDTVTDIARYKLITRKPLTNPSQSAWLGSKIRNNPIRVNPVSWAPLLWHTTWPHQETMTEQNVFQFNLHLTSDVCRAPVQFIQYISRPSRSGLSSVWPNANWAELGGLGLISNSCLGVLGGNWVVTFNMWRQQHNCWQFYWYLICYNIQSVREENSQKLQVK